MSTGRETGQNSGLMNASIDGTTIGEALRGMGGRRKALPGALI